MVLETTIAYPISIKRQIKYFPLNPLRGNSIGIVSYTESSINVDGTIKSDSLHYLDESLDVEMEKYNLYY